MERRLLKKNDNRYGACAPVGRLAVAQTAEGLQICKANEEARRSVIAGKAHAILVKEENLVAAVEA